MLLGIFVCLNFPLSAQIRQVEPNPYGERPVIVPVPSSVAGVQQPVLILNQGWEMKPDPESDFWKNTGSTQGWTSIEVPMNRRGFSSVVTGYRNTVTLPGEFSDKRIILRFDAVAHDAQLWVNGKYVRNHWGSMVPWTCDITGLVTSREPVSIYLKVDETREGLAAFVRGRGIQSDVKIYALPEVYFERMRIDTKLDQPYKDATLRIWTKISPMAGNNQGKIKITLTDAKRRNVRISPSVINIPARPDEFEFDVAVSNPLKWDAEHPNLYTLDVALVDAKGKSMETLTQKIGFRQVERRGKQLFVNGCEVKFRGIWGGQSAHQLRNMNVNHTRQKWATEAFLDSCDHYGIYVLNENPVDFAKFGAESNPKYAYQWMSLIAGLMERDFNHPSVVMWGLGNESFHGVNVLKTHHYAAYDDRARPTMFSWANRVRTDEELPYTVYSSHYPNVYAKDVDLSEYDVSVWHSTSLVKNRVPKPELPVLADEAIHTVLSSEEIRRDPNVRNFWGESIKRFWDLIWNTPGALGGDQFGMFSDLPRGDMPEVWLMRKAYSPVRIEKRIFDNPGKGKGLAVPVENRFNHTNLKEISILWQVGGQKGAITGPDLEPRGKGFFTVPYKEWKDGDRLEVQFVRADGFQFDEYVWEINPQPYRIPQPSGIAPAITENTDEIRVKGNDFEIVFDKYAGQLTSGIYKGERLITRGPHLQFVGSGSDVGEYWPQSMTTKTEGSEAVITIDAIYSPIKVRFEVRIDGNGMITTHYNIISFPDAPPAPRTLPWNGTNIGGFSEIGLSYELSGEIDRLEWERKGLWTVYPKDHIGREKGTAVKYYNGQDSLHWSNRNRDWQFSGAVFSSSRLTNDFRSSKEYIRKATAYKEGSKVGVQALSEEKDAVRMELASNAPTSNLRMIVNNLWNYPTLGIGNYMKDPVIIDHGYRNTVRIRFISLE